MLLPHANQFYQAVDRKFYSNTSVLCRADKYILYRGDYKNHKGIPALPFSKTNNVIAKPKPKSYPKELNTIGDHIRAWRLDNQLFQSDVASLLGVTEESVYNWEKGINPLKRQIPEIAIMLGYVPLK